jgi:ribosomal protein S18 acetylase RimI-like enzyme
LHCNDPTIFHGDRRKACLARSAKRSPLRDVRRNEPCDNRNNITLDRRHESVHIKSLAYQTDLIFPAFDGEIVDRGDYVVVRTPSNPTFYWGNFLLFSSPPGQADFIKWRRLFASEIGPPPHIEHQAYGWDCIEGETGSVEPFLQAGFALSQDVVLTASAVRPPDRPARAVVVRALESDADWQQALSVQMACREDVHEEGAYRIFRERLMDGYRRMSEAHRGHWYGAFIDGQIVADLGVFHQDGLGRYQSVETRPDFRRRGVAGTLVYTAGRQAMAEHNLHTLVMVAEADSAPARLYQSLGFAPKEKSAGMLWFPRVEQPAATS